MSVRPESLETNEGELVSLSITVEPSTLESLLEALAGVCFPINPQIYHGGAATLVEFPAYAGRVDEVRSAIAAYGFDPASIGVTGMLDEIQSSSDARRKRMMAAG